MYLHSLTKAWMAGGVHYKGEVVWSQTGDVRPTIFPTDGASLPSFNLAPFPCTFPTHGASLPSFNLAPFPPMYFSPTH